MISKIETNTVNENTICLYFRVPRNSDTQKAVNRFKTFLKEEMKVLKDIPRGIIGQTQDVPEYDRTSLDNDGIVVNIVKSEHYVHVIAVMNRELKPQFNKAIEYFHATKK